MRLTILREDVAELKLSPSDLRSELFRLQVAQVISDTEAEGPGRRFAVWLQGCPLRCPGCCNPEMLPFAGGTTLTVASLLESMAATPDIEGVTLLGGEPFAQAPAAASLCEEVRARRLGVMIFSGYTLAEIHSLGPDATRLLATCDLLVDGPYDRTRPDSKRRFIGSTNQRVHFLSDRHKGDPRLEAPNTVELRLSRGMVTINGWPEAAARVRRP